MNHAQNNTSQRNTARRNTLIDRLRFRRWTKRLGLVVFTAVFFVGYFLTLHADWRPVTVMPTTAIDDWVGFQPASLAFYVSLWIYIPIAPALIDRGDKLWGYFWTAVAIAVVGLSIFALWPTTSPPSGVNPAEHPAFAFLRSADHGRNACPSLHVAYAVFTALWLAPSLRALRWPIALRALNGVWCMTIVYATLATKQHVFVDDVAGATLALVAVAVEWRIRTWRDPVKPIERCRAGRV